MSEQIVAATANTVGSLVLTEIGITLLVLGIVAFIAAKLRFSVVPLYLVIGIAFGEGGAIPLDLSESFLQVGSQIGAILLLLLLGLEYSAPDLASAFLEKKSAGLVDFLTNALPGAAIAILLGWGPLAALALGGITYVSSSGIASQLIKETGWVRSEVARRTTSVLVFEDLALAPYLPLLTSMVFGLGAIAGVISVSLALVITGLVLLISFKGAGIFSKMLNPQEPAGLLLTVFGAALLAAGVADLAGFSGAVAAFLVGLLLTGEVASTVRARLSPLRDFFAAIFFVFFGLATNPADIPGVLPIAIALTIVGVAGKLFTGWWVARDMTDSMSWRRVGAFLTPRGEFSMVIATLAAPVVLVVNLQALTLAYVILTSLLASVLLRIFRSGFDKVQKRQVLGENSHRN